MAGRIWRFEGPSVKCTRRTYAGRAALSNLKFLVSLTTNDNDYQQEQATAAEETARRLGVEVQVIYADNDAIK